MQRYGYIASQPEGQIAKVRRSMVDMAFDAAVRGAVLGLLPVVVWLLVGPARRRELAHHHGRHGVVVGVALVLIGVLLWSPWADPEPTGDDAGRVDLARRLPRPRGHGARGGGGRGGPDRRDDRRRAAVDPERGRHLRQEPGVLRVRGQRGDGTRPPGAAGGRHRRRPGLRPPRQHRHGRGGPGDRGRGWRDGGLRRGRRHLDRPVLGGVQPRLGDQRLRGLRPLRAWPATTTTATS